MVVGICRSDLPGGQTACLQSTVAGPVEITAVWRGDTWAGIATIVLLSSILVSRSRDCEYEGVVGVLQPLCRKSASTYYYSRLLNRRVIILFHAALTITRIHVWFSELCLPSTYSLSWSIMLGRAPTNWRLYRYVAHSFHTICNPLWLFYRLLCFYIVSYRRATHMPEIIAGDLNL